MNRTPRKMIVVAAALGFVAGALTLVPAAASRFDPPPGDGAFELPPGWTMQDMMAYAEAATPGEMHEYLRNDVGKWDAKTTMWMMPGAEPMTSDGAMTVTSIMDGRFVQVDMTGEMPGMGPYLGKGVYGYNNVTKQFESIWIDNHSTSMMRGTGKLSNDRKTLTWELAYTCPLTKKPCIMREIERVTGENTKMLEMHGTDPKSGVEYKMMEIHFTRAE